MTKKKDLNGPLAWITDSHDTLSCARFLFSGYIITLLLIRRMQLPSWQYGAQFQLQECS